MGKRSTAKWTATTQQIANGINPMTVISIYLHIAQCSVEGRDFITRPMEWPLGARLSHLIFEKRTDAADVRGA
jgi:hypothetical protein